MLKKYCLIIIVFAVLPLLSCERNSSELKDGYYTSELAEFDSYGWKDYVTICVSGGRIIMVEYNAYNLSGFLKSWDMDYMRLMSASVKTYPSEYARHYARLFLYYQKTEGIDVLSGATDSYPIFIKLAKAVLENAREGDRNIALVHIGAAP